MNGLEIIKGLAITFGHMVNTYIQDFKSGKKRYYTPEGIAERSNVNTEGIFTIQYPEEKLPVPEEFRYIPFLVYDENEDGTRHIRCTSCGICAKACPPQCIWIIRKTDPNTGRPVPQPAEFFIDVDICMNCGFCAEYCPFDAIKMDHEYEISSYDRIKDNIYNIQKLLKPASYYAKIRPVNFETEEKLKKAEAEAKALKKAQQGS